MCHYLRVLPSISAFWTRKRQTLLLFAITLIKIWKQAKKKCFSFLLGQVCLLLNKIRFALSQWYEVSALQVPTQACGWLCSRLPQAECFLFEMAVLGSSEKIPSGQALLFCSTLGVSENSLSSLSVLPGGGMVVHFYQSFRLRRTLTFSHSLCGQYLSNPVTKNKRSSAAGKVTARIWGRVVRARTLSWREIIPCFRESHPEDN